jgi:hypothetical protein
LSESDMESKGTVRTEEMETDILIGKERKERKESEEGEGRNGRADNLSIPRRIVNFSLRTYTVNIC